MKILASHIVREMKPYFDGLLRNDPESGLLYIWDDELGDRASCCTTGLAASFYLMNSKLSGEANSAIAEQLAQDVSLRQLPTGAFTQPFYVKFGEPVTIDIAEIGAVANSLFHVYKETGSLAAKTSLLASADYLLTQVSNQNPGVVLKRPDSDNDVLNGDMYAAHTFGRAYEVSGNPIYLEKVTQIFMHLANRFGKNQPGWWPYIEAMDGSVVMGNSVAYQGTIVGFAHTALPLLPKDLQKRWSKISAEAVETMERAMQQPPSEETEAPWWTRDWSNGWELYLALWRHSSNPEVREIGLNRFREVEANYRSQGIDLFRPKIQNNEPGRTPVTTTFRKAAGVAGLLSCVILDEGWVY